MKEAEQVVLPDGRKLGYAEYGETTGRPVLFFHGWPSSRHQPAFLDSAARRLGLRLLAPDRPGVGLSDDLSGRRFLDWPADVAALADSLGLGELLLLGVSGGGPYTLATSAALPDRVRKAAVICGAPPLDDPEARAHMHWVYRKLGGIKALRRPALAAILPPSRWMVRRGPDRAPLSWLMRTITQRDRETLLGELGWEAARKNYLEAVRRGPAGTLADGQLYLEPWGFDPAQIKIPVAFWHGLADTNLPCEVAQRLAARIPGAEGHWVEGEGHYSIIVHYGAKALEWLAG